MFTIVLCDDDKNNLATLKDFIEAYLASKGILGRIYTFSDPLIFWADAQENIHRYDLFILDLEMPDLPGNVLVRKIKEVKSDAQIVLLTSHDEYALDAFELEVFRFIPKSQYKARLCRAVDTIYERKQNSRDRYYIHHSREGEEKIPHSSIVHISKDQKNSILKTVAQEEKSVRMSLADIHDALASDEFVFINRGIIVNLNHIQRVCRQPFDGVELSNGETFEISKARVKEIVQLLNANWSRET
ncbi:MAG: LytTR family DNA-binding domain-containing protein [Coriobacteriia bacterium]|nr:LytTR family DNA-binding domain-containing protein [Coriobacteriia bacterium]